MKIPAISVIIPLYNCAPWLRECLNSVVLQTLKDIEILIVDDKSTDNSVSIAEEYAAQDRRIRIFRSTENLGPGPSRNTAIAQACGEYIAFMDGDDFYPSLDVLEVLYHNALEHQAKVCGGSLRYVNADGSTREKQLSEYVFTEERFYTFREYQHEGGYYRFLYNNELLQINRLEFPPLRRFQDALFCVKTMLATEVFYAMPMISYAYRKGHKQVKWTEQSINDYFIGILELLNISKLYKLDVLHYCMAKNLYDHIYLFMKIRKYNILKILCNIVYSLIKYQNTVCKVKISRLKFILKLIQYKYFLRISVD